MRSKSLYLFGLAACIALTTLRAQDPAAIPPPTPPLSAPVPMTADWTVTVQKPPMPPSAPNAGVSPDRRITLVHSTKTGDIKRELLTYSDGTSEEQWYRGSLLFFIPLHGDVSARDISSDASTGPMDPNPSVATGFPGIGWLRLDLYDKVVVFEKRPCYHYVSDPIEAWIDVASKLPIAYKYQKTFYRFQFNTPPSEPLMMPPAFQKAWETLDKMISYRKRVNNDLGLAR